MKSIIVNGCKRFRQAYPFQRCTAGKSFTTYLNNASQNSTHQTGAVGICPIAHNGGICGQRNGGQASTSEKSFSANFLQSAGKGNLCKTCGINECAMRHSGYAFRNGHGCQVDTIVKWRRILLPIRRRITFGPARRIVDALQLFASSEYLMI